MVHPLTIPVGRTAIRPTWAELPSGVRELIERRLGGSVTAAASQGSGYTPGFASRLTLADGNRVFVKAADEQTRGPFADSYREEIRKLLALPVGVPVPRLRWSHDGDGWVVLCFDAITGGPPRRPWLGMQLHAAVDTVTTMSQLLTPSPPVLRLPTWRDELGAFPAYWERFDPQGAVAEHGAETVGLAQIGLAAGAGDTLVHCDLRDDNLILDEAGRVWVCDWNWPVIAAPWIDLLTLLISAYGDGFDADAILTTNPLARDVPSEDVDGVLALLAIYFLGAKEGESPATSPWLRIHQGWYADVTWSWLATRRGWR